MCWSMLQGKTQWPPDLNAEKNGNLEGEVPAWTLELSDV